VLSDGEYCIGAADAALTLEAAASPNARAIDLMLRIVMVIIFHFVSVAHRDGECQETTVAEWKTFPTGFPRSIPRRPTKSSCDFVVVHFAI